MKINIIIISINIVVLLEPGKASKQTTGGR